MIGGLRQNSLDVCEPAELSKDSDGWLEGGIETGKGKEENRKKGEEGRTEQRSKCI